MTSVLRGEVDLVVGVASCVDAWVQTTGLRDGKSRSPMYLHVFRGTRTRRVWFGWANTVCGVVNTYLKTCINHCFFSLRRKASLTEGAGVTQEGNPRVGEKGTCFDVSS